MSKFSKIKSGIVPTIVTGAATAVGNAVVDGVIDKSGVRLLGIVPDDKKIPFSSVTAVFPDKKSSFVKAVKRITGRIKGENIPLALKELK